MSARDRDWTTQAACRGEDPEIFFPNASVGRGGSQKRREAVHQARIICSRCPVQQECLEYAVETDSRFGVFGGHDETDRPNGGIA